MDDEVYKKKFVKGRIVMHDEVLWKEIRERKTFFCFIINQ